MSHHVYTYRYPVLIDGWTQYAKVKTYLLFIKVPAHSMTVDSLWYKIAIQGYSSICVLIDLWSKRSSLDWYPHIRRLGNSRLGSNCLGISGSFVIDASVEWVPQHTFGPLSSQPQWESLEKFSAVCSRDAIPRSIGSHEYKEIHLAVSPFGVRHSWLFTLEPQEWLLIT